MIGAILTLATVGITLPYTYNQFVSLTTYGSQTISDYTNIGEITGPLSFTVGEFDQDNFDFRFVLMLLDNNGVFPPDMDRIGQIYMYQY